MNPNALVHGDICKGFTEDAIMNCPGSQTDAITCLWLAEGSAPIQHKVEIPSRREALMVTRHSPASLLVGETVSFEDHRVVVVEGFSKINIVTQFLNKFFEGAHGG